MKRNHSWLYMSILCVFLVCLLGCAYRPPEEECIPSPPPAVEEPQQDKEMNPTDEGRIPSPPPVAEEPQRDKEVNPTDEGRIPSPPPVAEEPQQDKEMNPTDEGRIPSSPPVAEEPQRDKEVNPTDEGRIPSPPPVTEEPKRDKEVNPVDSPEPEPDVLGVLQCRVDLMDQNLSADPKELRLSWQLSPEIVRQDKYRIVLFDSAEAAAENRNCYDTGWIESALQTGLRLDIELQVAKLYYGKVRVQDADGKCYTSELFSFLTELDTSWAATDLVWMEADNRHNILVARLKMESENTDRVVLHAVGLGNEKTRQQLFDIFINETHIGCGPTRQTGVGLSQTVFYQSWDITDFCGTEESILTFVNYAEDAVRGILFQVNAYGKDGSTQVIFNSAQAAADLHVLNTEAMYAGSIGTGYFPTQAENLDSSVLTDGWNMAGCDFSDWAVPTVIPWPEHYRIAPYPSENMHRYLVRPVNIDRVGDGHYILDFGREIIGSPAMRAVSQTAGTVKLYLGEERNEDGSVRYQMRTANHYAMEWRIVPGSVRLEGLNVMGFRYLELIDCPFEVTENTVFAYAQRQDFDDSAADFDSSDKLLNDIYDLVRYSIKATNQSILVDSQTRERAPYEGDAYINSLASYAVSNHYSLPRFTQKWLIENRTWPLEYVYLSAVMMWQDYLYTGDSRFMEEYYDLLISRDEDRTLYLDSFDEEIGLIRTLTEGGGWDSVLVDWPQSERETFEYRPFNTIANAFAYAAFDALANIADAIGREDQRWSYYRDRIGQALVDCLYDEAHGAFSDGMDDQRILSESHTYHSTVYAMWSGALDRCPEVLNACRAYLDTMQSNCFSVYGTFYLLDVLSRYDMAEQAVARLTDARDIRSYHHLLYDLGATLTPEAWDPSIKGNMTFSHAWSSGGVYGITAGLVGIMPEEPGFASFTVAPCLDAGKSLTLRYPTVRGTVAVSCRFDREACCLRITVPGNTVCRFRVPNNWVVEQADGSTGVEKEILLHAGTHELRLSRIG